MAKKMSKERKNEKERFDRKGITKCPSVSVPSVRNLGRYLAHRLDAYTVVR